MDLIIGLISTKDKLHDISKRIFKKIEAGNLKNVFIPASVFLEYELVLKSKEIAGSDLLKDIIHLRSIENIGEIPLTSNIIINALKLREKYDLTYFDSLHCAGALQIDAIIISSDKDFKFITNLQVIEPKDFFKN